MNILLLTHSVPFPPESGPKVKTYYVLRYLALRHRVTLVSFAHPGDSPEQIAALRPLCAAIHTLPLPNTRAQRYRALATSLLNDRPLTIERDSSPEMHELLARLVREAAALGQPFDLVHTDQLTMAPYAERLPLPRLLDQHNAVHQIYETRAHQCNWVHRRIARREAIMMRRYEARMCSEFNAVTVVSEEDRQSLLKVLPQPRELTVIPIAVDTTALQPIPRDPTSQVILSLAAPDWPPNADGISWFAHEVYPLVRRAAPESQLFLCGAQPGQAMRALPEHDPSIVVTGFVNPIEYIARAACMIVPLRHSGGMRVMVLEALARGIPVVATSLGIAGLDLRPGEHVLVADTPSDFADAAALLLREPDLGRRIGAAGRQAVQERYDWRTIYRAIDGVYERMLAATAHTEPPPSLAAGGMSLPNGLGRVH
ncbi:MAG: glycosyltransferase [Oscillochloris sp.]|nr:glycosyltransferase [Oscillochloris sp.]